VSGQDGVDSAHADLGAAGDLQRSLTLVAELNDKLFDIGRGARRHASPGRSAAPVVKGTSTPTLVDVADAEGYTGPVSQPLTRCRSRRSSRL